MFPSLALAAWLTVAVAPPGPDVGRRVDIGGAELYLHCLGEVGPTVVLDAGAGQWSIQYQHLQQALAPSVRTCVYDRAGLGRSDAIPGPRTSSEMADELHRLLHAAGLEPPFVLAGHSLGGYTVRVYQRRFGAEVAALVLLDAAHPEQWERLPAAVRELVKAAVPATRGLAEAARSGALAANLVAPWPQAFDQELRGEYVAAMAEASTYQTQAAELEGTPASAAAVPPGPLGDLPLVVVTAGRSFDAFRGTGLPIEDSERVWQQLQRELVGLSSDAEQLISPEGDHALPDTDPGIIVRGIERAVAKARVNPGVQHLPTDPHHRLPSHSTHEVDTLLREIEAAYRSSDSTGVADLATRDLQHVDMIRRRLLTGNDTLRDQLRELDQIHLWKERVHHGRIVADNVVVAEVEWSGQIRGEALGRGEDVTYRTTGIAILELDGNRVKRQQFYGDAARLEGSLGARLPEEWVEVRGAPRSGGD